MNYYVFYHSHRFGSDIHLVKCNQEINPPLPDEDQTEFIKLCAQAGIDFEPDREEFIEVYGVSNYGFKEVVL